MTRLHLATIWNTGTAHEHSLTVVHRDVPLEHEDECHAKQSLVGRMSLGPDGTLTRHHPDGGVSAIDPDDVVIHVYTRPFELRGAPFMPDMATEAGRARMRAAMEDPRYRATESDHELVDISLKDLATIPGAVGGLSCIAIDTRRLRSATAQPG